MPPTYFNLLIALYPGKGLRQDFFGVRTLMDRKRMSEVSG